MSAHQPPRPSRVFMALGMATVLGASGNPPAPPPAVLTPIPARPVAATHPVPVAPPAVNPLAASTDAAERISGAWVEVVEGAGHFTWVEAPGAVRTALRRLTET